MNFLKPKAVCSNKIANAACDVFSGAQAKLQKGADEININLANRVVLRDSLKEQLAAVETEIGKDNAALELLKGKQEALASLI